MSLDKSHGTVRDWEWVKAKDFMLFNPRESVKKGTVVKNVPMDKIEPKTKEIPSYEITEYKGGVKFRNGDTLMARITPCLENGKISQVSILDNNEIGAGSTEFIVLREKEGVSDKDFIYYLSNSEFFKEPAIKSMVGSSGRQRVQRDVVENLEIFVPPLDTQKKIGKLLSLFDKKISLNKEINKNLRNLIKILYKNYFKSFEIGNIPDDWEIVNIESIIKIYNGYSYKGNELRESDCAMVTIKNFNRDGSFRTDGFKEIIYSDKIKKHHFINENDVLISCTDVTQDADIIGNCIILLDKQNYNELIMSMDLVKIESKIPEINNFLLATIFKSYSFKKHILGYVNGTTVLHLDKNGIKKFKIALPKNLSELKNISERFEIIYNEIQCNQKEINKLINLRDTLLPKLMSGEIDVSEIDI